MSKRALIIGSQTSGLSGVNNDVKAVDELISSLGFETTLCVEQKAKRKEILDGYEKLITDSQAGDAAYQRYPSGCTRRSDQTCFEPGCGQTRPG